VHGAPARWESRPPGRQWPRQSVANWQTSPDRRLRARGSQPRAPSAQDDATTAAAYIAGQVDLFGTANIVARALAKEHPDKEFATVYRIRTSPAHMGVRHGEFNLLRWLDTFIFYSKMNGKLEELHQKWMGESMADLPSF
jgi:polar amino acid transport system substrate-binding protein